MAQFYIITQPGMVEELESEIRELSPYLIDTDSRPWSNNLQILSMDIGGILIDVPEVIGYQINYFSKLASRVLERVHESKVRDFPKLKKIFEKLNLKPWFGDSDFAIEVAASKSRLNNEKRIADVAKEVFNIDENSQYTLLIRFHDDICTISVDTAGRHLHFRYPLDQEKWIGEAPLRETLAAFMSRKLIENVPLPDISKKTLWDPMAGSGTLIQEMITLHEPNLLREYVFQTFSKCPRILKSSSMNIRNNYPKFHLYFNQYLASDINEKMIESLKNNLKNYINDKTVIEILEEDFFNEIRKRKSQPNLWLIINPPYNERLGFEKGYDALSKTIAQSLLERFCILLPQKYIQIFAQNLKNFTLLSQTKLKNGGIPVACLVYNLTD